jgi:hypothetical protein
MDTSTETSVPWSDCFAGGLENGRVQDALVLVDVFDEAARAAFEGEVFFLAGALVGQLDVTPLFRKDSSRMRLARIS